MILNKKRRDLQSGDVIKYNPKTNELEFIDLNYQNLIIPIGDSNSGIKKDILNFGFKEKIYFENVVSLLANTHHLFVREFKISSDIWAFRFLSQQDQSLSDTELSVKHLLGQSIAYSKHETNKDSPEVNYNGEGWRMPEF